jgi:hypothetical protein
MDIQALIEKAGGVPALGKRLGVARTTVLDWKRDGKIPGNRVAQIAAELKVDAGELLPLVRPAKAAAPEPAEAA